MKRFYIIITLLLAGTVITCAQTDTTYIITRNGVDARFTFKKSSSLSEIRNYTPLTFPVYSMTKNQHIRVRELLNHYVSMESEFDALRKNYNSKDSVFRAKETALMDAYQKQELRAKNFETSYNKLLTVNETLDKDLKKCEELAKGEHKKKNKKAIVVGLIAGVVGFLVGAAL
jgi:hypothetical protein